MQPSLSWRLAIGAWTLLLSVSLQSATGRCSAADLNAAADLPRKGPIGVAGAVGEVKLADGKFEIRSKVLPAKRARVQFDKSTPMRILDVQRLNELSPRSIVWVLAKLEQKREVRRLEKVAAIATGEFHKPQLTKKRSAKKGYAWHQGTVVRKDEKTWLLGEVELDVDGKQTVAVFSPSNVSRLTEKKRVHVYGKYAQAAPKSGSPDVITARRLTMIEADISDASLKLILPIGFLNTAGKSIIDL